MLKVILGHSSCLKKAMRQIYISSKRSKCTSSLEKPEIKMLVRIYTLHGPLKHHLFMGFGRNGGILNLRMRGSKKDRSQRLNQVFQRPGSWKELCICSPAQLIKGMSDIVNLNLYFTFHTLLGSFCWKILVCQLTRFSSCKN